MRKSRFAVVLVTVMAMSALVLFPSLVVFAGKEFVMPSAQAARSYPAHDDHPTEKVAIAVDPYDMADKAQIFSVNYAGYGYLPVFFVVTNDGDQPVALSSMKPQLITVNRTKLYPSSTDDLLRRMSRPSRNDRPGVQLPIPLPRFVERKNAVMSMNPPTVKSASPM